MFKKNFSLPFLVIIVSLLLGGMALAQDVTEVTFWHHEAPAHRVKAIEEVLNMFEEEHPGVDIKQEVVSWGDAYAKTLSAIRSNTVPDFQFDLPELNIVANQAGGILPVTDLVKELDEKHNILDSQMAPYNYDGEYWGVPVWTMPFVLLYRPSYLEKYVGTSEPPETWEEVLEYAKKMTVDTDNDGETDIYGIGITASDSLLTQEMIWAVMSSYGTNVFDEEGNLVFDSPETVKALEMYKKLFKYTSSSATGWSWGEFEMNLAAGNLAMAPYFGGIQRRFYEAKDFDIAATTIPVPAAGGRGTTISYPNGIHIFKATRERGTYEIVKEFIKFLMQPEILARFTAGQEPGSFVPVTEDAAKVPEFWNNSIVSAYEDINKVTLKAAKKSNVYGFATGKAVNLSIGKISGANLFAKIVQKAVVEDLTPQEAIDWGEEEMKKYMQ